MATMPKQLVTQSLPLCEVCQDTGESPGCGARFAAHDAGPGAFEECGPHDGLCRECRGKPCPDCERRPRLTLVRP